MASTTSSVLGLQLPTDPRWVHLAEKRLEDILTDHAYCEQKAASTCISLIQQYPEKQKLVDDLAPIVTEEWGHFRLVLQEMRKRGLELGRQRKDEYVAALKKCERKEGGHKGRLLERLLIAALIEARSCERFKLLSENLEEEDLRKFYRHFMESEAGHYRLFIDIAKTYFDDNQVQERWQEFLEEEAQIMKNISIRGDRMH